ncbi:MAG TPA: methyltransferase domain-containing protein, partial [Pirellulaceae bacterium]|nr:methyltransferase domain-containing protein [Pirellulaceae bacterium]
LRLAANRCRRFQRRYQDGEKTTDARSVGNGLEGSATCGLVLRGGQQYTGGMLQQRTIPGGWRDETVEIAGRRFDLLLPASPDDVFYHLEHHPEAAADLGHDPYWAQLWPTSRKLAETLLSGSQTWSGTAIELGCGVGLVGLAAATLGMQVTFSDYNPLAVELALENARRNGFSQATGLVLDWRDPPAQTFDAILASDVIYDRKLHQPLLNTLAQLSHANSTIWIGDGGRSATEEFVAEAQANWKLQIVDFDGHPRPDIHVGSYRRLSFQRK